MEQLIELLKQIQELAGVGVDALTSAGKAGGKPADKGGEPAPSDGGNGGDGGNAGNDRPPVGPPQ